MKRHWKIIEAVAAGLVSKNLYTLSVKSNMPSFKPRRQIIAEIKQKNTQREESAQKYQIFRERLVLTVTELKQRLSELFGKLQKQFFTTLSSSAKTYLFFHKKLNAVLTKSVFPKLIFLKVFSVNVVRIGFSTAKLWITSTIIGIRCTLGFVKRSLWQLRYSILLVLLLVQTLFNLNSQFYRFGFRSIDTAIRNLNYWPLLPQSNLTMAKESFDIGHEEMALLYLEKTGKQLQKLELFQLDDLIRPSYTKIQKYIATPEQKRVELNKVNTLLKDTPYSWELLLRKAELEAELYLQKELEKTLALICWINPQFEPKTPLK